MTSLLMALGACGASTGSTSQSLDNPASNSNRSSGMQLTTCAGILPVGDSITLGVNGGYRNNLYTGLLQNNCGVSYVGTQLDQYTHVADKHHEGHTGFNIDNVAGKVSAWTSSMQPNIILLMAGTNDTAWWSAKNADEIGASHNALIDQFKLARPDAWIFVASLPPQTSAIIQPNNVDRAVLTQQLNAVIRKNVNARAAAGQRVRFVDVNSVLTTADLYDGIHPTEEAHAKVAQKFLDVIRATLSSSSVASTSMTLPVIPNSPIKQQRLVNFIPDSESPLLLNSRDKKDSNTESVDNLKNAMMTVSSDVKTQVSLGAMAASGESYFPPNFTLFNNKLYFRAYDSVHGDALWKTDGTSNGTVLMKASNTPIILGSHISILTAFNGALYFQIDDSVNGTELWKTDGTTNGSVMVKNINSTAGTRFGSSSSDFIVFSGALYFGADGSLWKTDGTAEGTTVVKMRDISGASFTLESFTLFNGMLYFNTEDAVNGRNLWKTDGTDAGTALVKSLYIANGMGLNPSVGLGTLNGSLYFQIDNGINGMELWKTEGTPTNTQLVKAFCSEKCNE